MIRKTLLFLLFFFISIPCFADHYYIGQWVWNDDDPGLSYWEAPHQDFLTGSIDLRSIPQSSNLGGVPQGYGIFTYSQQISDNSLIYIGGGKDEQLTNPIKNKLKTELGLSLDIVSGNISDVIYEILTVHADPTGLTKWKPLMPNHKLNMEIYIGTEGRIKLSKLVPNKSPEWENVLAVIHQDYRENILTTDHTLMAKNLDFLEEKFGVSYETFIPKDADIKLASLPHDTVIGDTFTNTNGTALTSHISTGDNSGFNWTLVSGFTQAYDIESNQIELAGSDSTAREVTMADSPLSSDDHYAQLNIVSNTPIEGAAFGIMVRKGISSSDATFYWGDHNRGASPDDARLFKTLSGSNTQLGSNVSDNMTSGLLKLEINGSTLTYYRGGVQKRQETDTSITGKLYTGINADLNSSSDNLVADSFEAGDLSAAKVVDEGSSSWSQTGSQVFSQSFAMPSVTDGYLVVTMSNENSETASNFQFDSVSLIQAGTSGVSNDRLELWYLSGPNAGTLTLEGSFSGTSNWVVTAHALSNVEQAAPYDTTADSCTSCEGDTLINSTATKHDYMLLASHGNTANGDWENILGQSLLIGVEPFGQFTHGVYSKQVTSKNTDTITSDTNGFQNRYPSYSITLNSVTGPSIFKPRIVSIHYGGTYQVAAAPATSKILLNDGTSQILLDDGSSKLLLAN